MVKAKNVKIGNNITFTSGPAAILQSARTRRRFDEGNPAKRPKQDRVSLAASLATGEGMSKFVCQHNGEERQIFECCPNWIPIAACKSHDFKCGDNEPGEMQVDSYSCQAKYREGALHWQRWLGNLSINNRRNCNCVTDH